MSTTSAPFVNQLYSAASSLNRYGSLIILVFGSFGIVLNILIFSTDQELKRNPCARLFLASSIAAGNVLFSGLPTRFFNSFGLDLAGRYDILCKSYMFILLGSFACSSLFTALVSIERWLHSCTNPNYRLLASMKNVNRSILVITIVVAVLYSHIFYCFSANSQNGRSPCGISMTECIYFNDFLHLILFVIAPSLIMSIFGSLTLFNIRRSLRRVVHETSAVANKTGRRTKRTQSTMTVLMFAQTSLVVVSNLPSGIQKIYSNITVNDRKSPERRAIEAVTFQLFFLLTYVATGVRSSLNCFH